MISWFSRWETLQMHYLPRCKTYTTYTLYHHPVKESSIDPTSVTLLLGYIESRMWGKILIIIFYPTPCGDIRAAGVSFILLLSHVGQPPSLNPLCNPHRAHTKLTPEYTPSKIEYNSTLDVRYNLCCSNAFSLNGT